MQLGFCHQSVTTTKMMLDRTDGQPRPIGDINQADVRLTKLGN